MTEVSLKVFQQGPVEITIDILEESVVRQEGLILI